MRSVIGSIVIVVILSGCALVGRLQVAREGIVDRAGVLADCTPEVVGAAAHLAEATDTTLHLELLPDTGGSTLVELVDARWDELGLRGDQRDVVVIATTDEPHAQVLQSMALDGVVTQDELDHVIRDQMRPPAQAGDWCAAMLAFIVGYEQAVTEDVLPRALISPRPS